MSQAASNEMEFKWDVIVTKTRVDAFSHDQLKRLMLQLFASGRKRIALDLKNTRFLSLPTIQFVVQTAQELRNQGGQLALLSPSEKTKRHFEIYGSLSHISIFRGLQDLDSYLIRELGSEFGDGPTL